MVRTGKGELRELAYEPSLEEVAQVAQHLREHPELLVLRVPAALDLGQGPQDVGILVAREVLVGLAGAVEGAVDGQDAGHRFWHWRNPASPRPCADCPETIAAEDAAADQARAAFVTKWSTELGVEPRAVEDLLVDYAQLPARRTPRT
jgi:hypothetical protein